MKRRILSSSFALLAIVVLAIYLYRSWPELSNSIQPKPWWLALLLVATVAQLLARNGLSYIAFKSIDRPIRFQDCLAITTLSNAANQVLPFNSGVALRAYYLKRLFQLDYAKSTSTLIAGQLIGFWVAAIIASIGLLFLPLELATIACLCVSLLGVVAPPVVLLIFRRKATKLPTLFGMRFGWPNRVLEGLQTLGKAKSAFTKMSLTQVGILLLEATAFWIACRTLNLTISVQDAVVLTSVVAISGVLNLTPSNIGIQEAILGLLASAVELLPAECIAVGLTIRFIRLARSTALVPLAILYLHAPATQVRQLAVSDSK